MHQIWQRWLLTLQAAYYLLTGLWPLVHLSSFEAVTGPKTDDWLVRMVGLLTTTIAMALGLGAARKRPIGPEMLVLAIGTALAFAGIDLWYALSGRIAAIYLADAVLALAAALTLTSLLSGRPADPL